MSGISTYPTVQTRKCAVTLPPHTLPGTVHLPYSISEFCGFFFLNLSILFHHPRSGHHLFWIISTATLDGPAYLCGLLPPSNESTKCSPSAHTAPSLANAYSSFRFPIISSRKTTEPDLGALAMCFLSKNLQHDTVISYVMSVSLCRTCLCG